VTSLGLITDAQSMVVLDDIGKVCKQFPRRVPQEDDIIHDVIFPFVLIEMFKNKYTFTTDDALARIVKQDEFTTLFDEASL
jgi:CRISPR/Cas system-associated endonuclease Cas3-HD